MNSNRNDLRSVWKRKIHNWNIIKTVEKMSGKERYRFRRQAIRKGKEPKWTRIERI